MMINVAEKFSSFDVKGQDMFLTTLKNTMMKQPNEVRY